MFVTPEPVGLRKNFGGFTIDQPGDLRAQVKGPKFKAGLNLKSGRALKEPFSTQDEKR